jgi:glycosyltransferase involved in cell wall biosynthesis
MKFVKTYTNPNAKHDLNLHLSVIVTFFNHQNIINSVLTGITDSVKLNYELIVINDGSTKETHKIIKDFLEKASFPDNLLIIRYAKFNISRFETKCDNLGAEIAKGKYLLFLQGDMVLKDSGLDLRLISILNSDSRIGAISGHGVHCRASKETMNLWQTSKGSSFKFRELRKSLFKNFKKKYENLNNAYVENFDGTDNLEITFKKHRSAYYNDTKKGVSRDLIDKNIIFIGKYINRGPILIEKKYFEGLGMYNGNIYFQGFDDIDLSLQICKDGKVVGFSPVNYISESEWGACRQKKSWLTILNIFFQTLKRRNNRKYSLLLDKNLVSAEHPLYGEVLLMNSQ